MKTEKKTLIDMLKENTESRFSILKKTLAAYWIISIIFIIALTITILSKENILYYAYGFTLGITILIILYHIFALYIIYQDCKTWFIPKTWVIGVFFLGPIMFTIYYTKQKSKPITSEEPITTEETETSFEKETTPEKPIAEYKEVINTSTKKLSKTQLEQVVWRDVEKIEKEVDTLHIKRAKKPTTEIDRKINHLVNKKK